MCIIRVQAAAHIWDAIGDRLARIHGPHTPLFLLKTTKTKLYTSTLRNSTKLLAAFVYNLQSIHAHSQKQFNMHETTRIIPKMITMDDMNTNMQIR